MNFMKGIGNAGPVFRASKSASAYRSEFIAISVHKRGTDKPFSYTVIMANRWRDIVNGIFFDSPVRIDRLGSIDLSLRSDDLGLS